MADVVKSDFIVDDRIRLDPLRFNQRPLADLPIAAQQPQPLDPGQRLQPCPITGILAGQRGIVVEGGWDERDTQHVGRGVIRESIQQLPLAAPPYHLVRLIADKVA